MARRRLITVASSFILVAAGAVSVTTTPAGAAGNLATDPCTTAGGTLASIGVSGRVTCTFDTPRADLYDFTLPSEATDVVLDAYGAQGGGLGDNGGKGAHVHGEGLDLAGIRLAVGVGQEPAGSRGGGGLFNGGDGGTSGRTDLYGGGGGGASGVAAFLSDQPAYAVVAGGGGGGEAGGVVMGGNAGADGEDGGDLLRTATGGQGGGGAVTEPGAGGAKGVEGAFASCNDNGTDGGDGSINGPGGAGGSQPAVADYQGRPGGGGGGGWFGGGGGGAGALCYQQPIWRSSGGGGGGGGASYVNDDLGFTASQIRQGAEAPETGDGRVVITYTIPPGSAPTVTSATAPTKLKGSPFVVTFSRPVKGVSTSSVTVVQVGPISVAGSVACRDSGGNAVNCVNGPVTTARFTPRSPLIAGEYYFVNVNQLSSEIVAYDDDLALTPSQTYVRAQTQLTAFDYPVTYKWARVANAKALGGSYVRDGSGGATATATLKLASTAEASVVLWGGPAQGIANINVTTNAGSPLFSYNFDTYRTRGRQLDASLGALGAGTYKVTVTVTGNKNAASAGTFVGFDGVVASGVTTANPKLVVMWPNFPGDYAYDYTKGTSVSLTFRGTGVEWTALVGPNNGIAKVTIDGAVVEAARDLYAPSYSLDTFTYDGLSDGFHTIVITTTGTKQTSSTDTVITVRGFTVL